MTAAAWSSRFSSGGEPVDARGQDRLDRGRHLERLGPACASRYAPRSPASAPVSTSVRTLSSRKNGLPSVRSISSGLSGASAAIVAEQASSSSSALSAGSGSSRSWV